jgi:hypothetical protein
MKKRLNLGVVFDIVFISVIVFLIGYGLGVWLGH